MKIYTGVLSMRMSLVRAAQNLNENENVNGKSFNLKNENENETRMDRALFHSLLRASSVQYGVTWETNTLCTSALVETFFHLNVLLLETENVYHNLWNLQS